MPKVISIREENSQEKKLREWFEMQSLEIAKKSRRSRAVVDRSRHGLAGRIIWGADNFCREIAGLFVTAIDKGILDRRRGIMAGVTTLWVGRRHSEKMAARCQQT